MNSFGVSKEWTFNPTPTSDLPSLTVNLGAQGVRNVFLNHTGPRTSLEQRQAKNRKKYYRTVRAANNVNAGMDIANVADRAAAGKQKQFRHTERRLLGRKTRTFERVSPKAYRQKGMDPRRMEHVDAHYKDSKNLPKGKTIVWYEGKKGRILPGKMSAVTHGAEDSAKTSAVSFNTKPVWFNHKSKGRVKWEKGIGPHELGHAATKRTGRDWINDQIDEGTNRKGRRAHMVPRRIVDFSALEEGKADRRAVQLGAGMGRKRNKGLYEVNGTGYKRKPAYWEGRNYEGRDARFPVRKGGSEMATLAVDAFGVSTSFQMDDAVHKDLAGAARWTTKAGKTVSLKAKEAPVRAQVRAINTGERLLTTAPKKPTKARTKLRRMAGKVLEDVGYKPYALSEAFEGADILAHAIPH